MKIAIINGPNINMLGLREPSLYGSETYSSLVIRLKAYAAERGVQTEFYQSNCEGEIVSFIQAQYKNADAIILNAAAYSHTSVAVLDALKAVAIPTVCVHITDVSLREPFRRIDYPAFYAEKTIKGEGVQGYFSALDYLVKTYCK